METAYWIALLSALVALVGILVTIWIFNNKQRNKRIDDFEQNFFKIYKGAGVKLECLIPAGINNLKNDNEIEIALEKITNRIKHPFRHDNQIQEIKKAGGYKKFFQYTVDHKIELNPSSIDIIIEGLKNGG